jgi:hypothetical protein
LTPPPARPASSNKRGVVKRPARAGGIMVAARAYDRFGFDYLLPKLVK